MSDQFIFWDLETTGRNDKFDQITQVGAVLTDHNFEVKDKLEIHSKLREGKWFEPGALITTGVDPLNLFQNNYLYDHFFLHVIFGHLLFYHYLNDKLGH